MVVKKTDSDWTGWKNNLYIRDEIHYQNFGAKFEKTDLEI